MFTCFCDYDTEVTCPRYECCPNQSETENKCEGKKQAEGKCGNHVLKYNTQLLRRKVVAEYGSTAQENLH